MHNKRTEIQLYCSKLLILLSFVLFTYGFILDLKSTHKLIDPVSGVTAPKNQTVSVTPAVGTEVVSEELPDDISKESGIAPIENVDNSSTNDNSNTNPASESNNGWGSSEGVSNYNIVQPSLEDNNNSFRRQIESTYGITVKYGSETNGYSVGGIGTVPIYDPYLIASALTELNNALSLYPSGLFTEIRNGGIPLTVILINNYSDNSITGVTDSDYNSAVISIATIYPFGESFFHESYHYIERYMFKKGANFITWDFFNPAGFSYGNIRNDYSYANTFAESAPFVNNYAQTDGAEDRASTFEYMMAPSKASCLNYGTTVWQKANLMSENIDAVLNSVRPDVIEYWERYLY